MADPTAESTPGPVPGRGGFGPVVLLGLATAALAAVSSAKPWIGGTARSGSTDASMTAIETGTRYPLASAISLVLLAAWGVLLVTRGGVRRAFAILTVIAALGLLVSVVVAYMTLPDTARDSLTPALGGGSADTGFNGWFWTTAVCSVVALLPAALAARLVGRWPEMGSRYDAPGAPVTAAEESSNDPDRDLWHALDEGRDPTDTGRG